MEVNTAKKIKATAEVKKKKTSIRQTVVERLIPDFTLAQLKKYFTLPPKIAKLSYKQRKFDSVEDVKKRIIDMFLSMPPYILSSYDLVIALDFDSRMSLYQYLRINDPSPHTFLIKKARSLICNVQEKAMLVSGANPVGRIFWLKNQNDGWKDQQEIVQRKELPDTDVSMVERQILQEITKVAFAQFIQNLHSPPTLDVHGEVVDVTPGKQLIAGKQEARP